MWLDLTEAQAREMNPQKIRTIYYWGNQGEFQGGI